MLKIWSYNSYSNLKFYVCRQFTIAVVELSCVVRSDNDTCSGGLTQVLSTPWLTEGMTVEQSGDSVIINLAEGVSQIVINVRPSKNPNRDDDSPKGPKRNDKPKSTKPNKIVKQCRATATSTGRRCRQTTECHRQYTAITRTGRCTFHRDSANDHPEAVIYGLDF